MNGPPGGRASCSKHRQRKKILAHSSCLCADCAEYSITTRMTPFSLPPGNAQIKCVQSFHELVTTRFANGVNALCWQRTLAGDFGEIVKLLGSGEAEPITTLDEARLTSLPVSSAAGRAAIDRLLADLQLLREHALDPALNCIHDYPRDDEPGPVPTDVFSFHADSATVEADTFLCTYYGSPSEGLRNDEVQRRVDIPETRSKLLELFGGMDNDGFSVWLSENCYDLHYAPRPNAAPYSFGLGNLWRIATAYPGCPVPPCVHRAPATVPGQPRLLLIS